MLTALFTCLPKGCKGTACLDGGVADTALACGALHRDSMPMECKQRRLLHVDLNLQHNDWGMLSVEAQQYTGMDLRLLVWTACFAKSAGDL